MIVVISAAVMLTSLLIPAAAAQPTSAPGGVPAFTPADGTVITANGTILQTTALAPVYAPDAVPKVSAYVASLPFTEYFSFTYDVMGTIFKSSKSKICVDPIYAYVNGHNDPSHRVYFSLMHYHPSLGGWWTSDDRGPVYFNLDGLGHAFCWTGQNTSYQWSILVSRGAYSPPSGTMTGTDTVQNS